MNKIKLISIFLLLGIIFYSNSICLKAIPIEKTIDITNKKISITGGLASNVLVIHAENDKDKKFFKEQKYYGQKLDINEMVNFYFEKALNNTNDNEKNIILEKLSDPQNLNKFLSIGQISFKTNSLPLFLNFPKYYRDIIDMLSPVSNELKKTLPDFLKYISREIKSIEIENGKSQQNYPNGILRSLATYKLAKLLNLSDIIVKTEYAAIKQTGKKDKVGILMENANGITQNKFLSSNKKVLPNFQRELANLFVFDAICMQNDRSPNNYMCKTNKSGNAIGVIALDNDCSFSCNTNLTDPIYYLQPILTADNKINFPYMDEELAKNIININFNVVTNELQDLIAQYEIHALILRIKKIQNAIKNTINENKYFLLKKDQWSHDTLNVELSQKYKNTYLKRFLKLK